MGESLRPLRSCLRRARAALAAPIELALAGAIVAIVAVSTAYAAGWITPGAITPVTIIEVPAGPRRLPDGLSPRQGGLPGGSLRRRRVSPGQPIAVCPAERREGSPQPHAAL